MMPPSPPSQTPRGVRRSRRKLGHSFSYVGQGPFKIDANLSGDAERSNYLMIFLVFFFFGVDFARYLFPFLHQHPPIAPSATMAMFYTSPAQRGGQESQWLLFVYLFGSQSLNCSTWGLVP